MKISTKEEIFEAWKKGDINDSKAIIGLLYVITDRLDYLFDKARDERVLPK